MLCDFDLVHTIGEVAEEERGRAGNAAQPGPSCASASPPSSTTVESAPEPEPRFWGTEEYVAPEVLQGGAGAYSPASDWWALGVLG